MTMTMTKRRVVQRRKRPFPLVTLALFFCLISFQHERRSSTCAFGFSTSHPAALHKLMFTHQSKLLAHSEALRSGKNEEQSLSSRGARSKATTIQKTKTHRRNVIAAIASTIIIASTKPQSANADVTNKIASQTALRSLSNLQAQLPMRLKPLAQSNNYVGIKQCLREPPLDGIRKNMLTLVRGGEDGPKAGELLLAYKRLISALENIDASATLGMQGRNKKNFDPFLLSLQYEEVEKALGLFIEVGSAAASIPLQEDDGGQTKVGSIDVRSGEVTPRVL